MQVGKENTERNLKRIQKSGRFLKKKIESEKKGSTS